MSNLNSYTRADEGIPPLIRTLAWVLIVAGCFFTYVFNFNPGLSFPGASITDYSSQLGFSSTAVRVLSSVVALLISVCLNNAKFMAIALASRVVGEWGDVIVGLVTIEITGGVVSIVHAKVAGVASTLPAVSIARTAKLWLPAASVV